jgi:Tfp pilus assembly protein PilF
VLPPGNFLHLNQNITTGILLSVCKKHHVHFLKKLVVTGFFVLIVNSVYLASCASPTMFYVANVFYHVLFGLLLIPTLFVEMGRTRRTLLDVGGLVKHLGWLAYLLLLISAMAGLALIVWHNTRPNRWILHVHIATAALAVCLILTCLISLRSSPRFSRALRWLWPWGLAVPCVGILIPAVALSHAGRYPNTHHIVENPVSPPTSMDEEGMLGKEGPFFPSSAETNTRGLIPSNFFMNSESCGQTGCHPDIYAQWNSSAHHFSSFNNQWYRKSIEYMQEINGVQSSKWCAGCHDQAMLFSGMFDRPIHEIVDTPEAHTGIGCNGCHAIVGVKDTMGNGAYTIEYPPLHNLAACDNPLLRFLHDFLVRVDPGPHKKTFMKPFHREQTAEFCSSCHKVHLDKPVNSYRWLRGFNEYDNWQASGVSGQGARSFYYPETPQKCADCHMPLVASKDAGHINGFVHNHRFPGANTALPVANQDDEQLQVITDFLKDDQVRVDIFAMSEPGTDASHGGRGKPASREPRLSSTFGVGEEQGMSVGVGGMSGVAPRIIAPLNEANAIVRRGDSVRLDVVVRTLNVGHFFPGGTVDAFDVWLELKAVDNLGQTVYWSGAVRDNGKGPVEKGAHFYRSFMLDGHGNPINKRNTWATRSTLYVNLIPPGASDVAHFRLTVPETCGNTLTLTAGINYRKFAWWNTQFSYAGVRDPNQTNFAVNPHFDDGQWLFTGDTSTVSGALKEIPDLPIVVMASDQLTLQVRAADEILSHPAISRVPSTRERWNDYGIGLLRQGDLIGAEKAFLQVTQIEPDYADGWVNVARVRLRAGDIEGAEESLREALVLAPNLAKSHYFYALTLKSQGHYGMALAHLRQASAAYPRDRVVRNQMGRMLFLQKEYEAAIGELKKVLSIDPEDLQAHYNLMLSYRGLGDMDRAIKAQTFYMRFKANEASQAITGAARRQIPEANNERQPIHEHESVPLPWEDDRTDTSSEPREASGTGDPR